MKMTNQSSEVDIYETPHSNFFFLFVSDSRFSVVSMDPKEKSPISSSPLSSPSSIPPPPPLESGLPVTQPVVWPSSSSPLMDFEDLPSARASSSLGVESKRDPFGESSVLAGLSSTFSSASPSGEIGGFSAVKLSAPMETESKGVFSGGGRTYLTADEREREFVEVPQPLECLQGNPIPPFLSKTYDLVEDPCLDPIISWGSSGETFVVWDTIEFARVVLPQNFKHNNFSSFVRQLNTYGFRKIDTDRWEFANEEFVRGKKHLLKNIHRRKSPQSQQIGGYSGSSVEAGKSGLGSDLERLRSEKNLMMQEVVKLQQEHCGTAQRLEATKQRLQTAEQRQKQMVSFLAKLLQNPVFLACFQQKAEQKEVGSPRVRRKFIKQQPGQIIDSPMEGQIVKYNPDWSSIPTTLGTQELEPVVDKQYPDYILEDMVEKLGFSASGLQVQIGNVASTEMQQDLIGPSDQMGVGTLDSGPMGSEGPFIKGKNVVSPQHKISPEYHASFVEDLARQKAFSGYTFPGDESLVKPEDIWNMGFDASGATSSSSHDVWDNLVNYDVQELGVPGGLSDLWDPSSLQAGEISEIDKWPGDVSVLDDFDKQYEERKADPSRSTGP